MLIMKQEKPHKCNECGRSFPTPGDLRAHGYSHTGNWPMRCPVCNRGFCKPGALHHHMQLHNGNVFTFYNYYEQKNKILLFRRSSLSVHCM